MDWTSVMLVTSLIINSLLFSTVIRQQKEISSLRRKQACIEPIMEDEAFIASINDKVETIGIVPTVKFLRETHGLSLLEAKQLVDRVNKQ